MRKLAFVVVPTYSGTMSLATGPDFHKMSDYFGGNGYEIVALHGNITSAVLENALNQVRIDDSVFFYFSGHGKEDRDGNQLILSDNSFFYRQEIPTPSYRYHENYIFTDCCFSCSTHVLSNQSIFHATTWNGIQKGNPKYLITSEPGKATYVGSNGSFLTNCFLSAIKNQKNWNAKITNSSLGTVSID